MKINFFYDEVKYRSRNTGEIKLLIIKVIRNENKIPGDLNFIFTSDNKIREMNREFLNHDKFTDVIAFDYGIGNIINGEIYISVDTVKINAGNYIVSFKSEIVRVIVHGTLHLCGYRDKKSNERVVMKRMEELWLMKFFGK